MAIDVAQYLLGTVTSLMLLAAGSALVRWRQASASTARRKAPPSPEESELASDLRRRVEALEADQAALSSTLEKLSTTVKRLTSRAGMQDLRNGRASSSVPPVGTSKAELLRFYGAAGKAGPEFARHQLSLPHTQEPN